MNKREIFKFSMQILLIIVLVNALLLLNRHAVFAVDVYGNDIFHVEIWQFNDGYSLKVNFTSSGGSVSLEDNKVVKIVVGIKLNKTLAVDMDEAVSYTKVYLNITGEINNQELTNNASRNFSDANFYYLREYYVWNVTGKPTAGATYSCSVKYFAYY